MGQNPKLCLAILMLEGLIDWETAQEYNRAFNSLQGKPIPWSFEELVSQLEEALEHA